MVADGLLVGSRGLGLWAGVDVDPAWGTGRDLSEALLARRVLVKDTHGSTVRIAPPLTITRDDLDLGLDAAGGRVALSRATASGRRASGRSRCTSGMLGLCPARPPDPGRLDPLDAGDPGRPRRGRPRQLRPDRRPGQPLGARRQASRGPAGRARRHRRVHRAAGPVQRSAGAPRRSSRCTAPSRPARPGCVRPSRRYPEVVTASSVTGDADAVLQVRAHDMRHLEQVVERIAAEPFVRRTRSTVVLSDPGAPGRVRAPDRRSARRAAPHPVRSPLALVVRLGRHDHHRARRVVQHRLAGRAEQQPGEPAAPARADHHEVDRSGELREQRRARRRRARAGAPAGPG